ncbi:MAG: hypothetical protein JWO37_2905 [Acidimicrobiales bacterium]|nr:hypothetical protein [Acidimicrobiales bacterium]
MFFIVWGWAKRVQTVGFVGPYTCARCGWAGTFWLRKVERRFKLYWIQLGRWKVLGHATVCRNCGVGSDVPREHVDELVASAQPLGTPDPMGPAPAAVPTTDAEPIAKQT